MYRTIIMNSPLYGGTDLVINCLVIACSIFDIHESHSEKAFKTIVFILTTTFVLQGLAVGIDIPLCDNLIHCMLSFV